MEEFWLDLGPMSERFDLVVIGAGPAGEKGAAQAAYFGKRVAVIEREPEPGGAAVHTGTLPSKTLRETALYLSGHRARDLYGVAVELEPRRHGAAPDVAQRRDRRGRVARRSDDNLERHRVDVPRRACARFVDAHTVVIEGRERSRAASKATSS